MTSPYGQASEHLLVRTDSWGGGGEGEGESEGDGEEEEEEEEGRLNNINLTGERKSDIFSWRDLRKK